MDSTTKSKNNKEIDLIVEGGPKERSNRSTIREKRQFPDRGKFWPEEKKIDILKEVDTKKRLEREASIPLNVSNVEAELETLTIASVDRNRINLQFTVDADPNFDRAKIWVKGYGTDNMLGDDDESDSGRELTCPFVLYGEFSSSPAQLIFEETAETIVIAVQAINNDGLGPALTDCPSVQVELN